MKKLFTTLLLAVITFGTIYFFSFTAPVNAKKVTKTDNNGTIYIKIKNDQNRGNLHVYIRSASSSSKLFEAQVAPNQTTEKTLNGLTTGLMGWYVVSLDWPGADFHNIAAGGGCIIASGYPAIGTNSVPSWQVAGTGAYGSIPILLR